MQATGGGCRQKSYSAVAPACDPTDWAGKCPWCNSGNSVIGDLTALWSELRPAPQDGVHRIESVSGTVNLVKSSCLGRVREPAAAVLLNGYNVPTTLSSE